MMDQSKSSQLSSSRPDSTRPNAQVNFAAILSQAYKNEEQAKVRNQQQGAARANILSCVPPPCTVPSGATSVNSGRPPNPVLQPPPPPNVGSNRTGPSAKVAPLSTTPNTTALAPFPLSPSRVPSSVFNNFQENLLYSIGSDQLTPASLSTLATDASTIPKLPPRPNTIVPNTMTNHHRGSAGNAQQLIDWNNLNNNFNSDKKEDSDRKKEWILSMYNQQNGGQQGTQVNQVLMSPTAVPINVPMMSPLVIPQTNTTTALGFNFVQNPLYTNHNAAIASMGGVTNGSGGFYHSTTTNPSNASHLYSNMINNNNTNNNPNKHYQSNQVITSPQQTYANLSGHFATACSVASPVFSAANGFHPHFPTNQQDLQVIMNKINNNSQQQQQNNNNQSPNAVLTPTSVFDVRQFHNSQSIIEQFDPLAQAESVPSPKAAQSVTPPPIVDEPKYEIPDDVTNERRNQSRAENTSGSDEVSGGADSPSSSNRHSYRNSKNEPINLLQVERRSERHSPELQEFFEHLRAMYMSICAKCRIDHTSLTNSGLVWSARIDVDSGGGGAAGPTTADTYMCSPATMKQKEQQMHSLSSSNASSTLSDAEISQKSAIFDVRFNSLVHAKLSGDATPTTNPDALLKSDSVWYSKKLSCSLDNAVDFVLTYVVFNFERSQSDEVNLDDFLLKINGRNEYLVPRTTLSSYVYIQQCKKMHQDIVLELVDQTLPEFWRPFLRSDSDYNHIVSQLETDQLLPQKLVNNIRSTNAHSLNIVLEELNLAFAQFRSLPDIEAIIREQSLFTVITGKIKDLFAQLSFIKTTRLKRAVDELTRYYEKHIINNGIGSGGVVSHRELMAFFEASFSELLRAFAQVIHMYSQTFPVNFELNPNDRPSVPNCTETITRQIWGFKLRPDVIAQVPTVWKQLYYLYSLRVVITHGLKVLDFRYSDKQAVDSEGRLQFDQEMVFSHTIVSDLPREARVEFQLLGIKSATMGASKIEVDLLSSTFFYVFDRENSDAKCMYRQGEHLLPMTTFDSSPPSFTINSYETLDHLLPIISDSNHLVSYNMQSSAPMLVFTLCTNNPKVHYYYPKVTTHQTNTRTNTLELNRGTFDRNSLRLNTPVPLNRQFSSYSNGSFNSGGNSNPDSLYGFYGRNIDGIDCRNRDTIISIVQRNPLDPLNRDEKAIIWEIRDNLTNFPGAILKILKCPPKWSHGDATVVCALLESFDQFDMPDSPNPHDASSPQLSPDQSNQKLPFCTAIEALQLLSSDYPDQHVRLKAVQWLKTVSTDELCDFLPQLVQSLRYEPHLDCSLIWLLFECSLRSARFCHHFYWLLKSCGSDTLFGVRSKFYLNALSTLCGHRVRQMFKKQDELCVKLEQICADIKQCKENMRTSVLKQRLEAVHEFLESCPISVPLSPSIQVCGLDISQCSYFSSNSLPLKIVFQGSPPYGNTNSMLDSLSPTRSNLIAAIYDQKRQLNKIIFKCGDDLRQDMLVMQIISIINRIWIRATLDLRLITFAVMNNADRTGMIELVGRSRTLRQIQVEYGVTGNFKQQTIANWLKRHNPGEFEYQMAVENFIHSCAGYVVITYLLGICDRHNDNIMVTTSGHLFHIDFGKFLGDAQMISGIRRDRTPFVFTADMAYVINEGDKPSKNYQFFVDLCCRCFSLVRQNGNFLLSLLSMMIPSGICGLRSETIQFFHKTLMPDLTDSQAQAAFYRLIEKALGSFATQLNFFMHTLAQLRFNSNQQSDVPMYYAAPNSSTSGGVVNIAAIADTTDLNSNQNGDGESDLTSLEHESGARFSFIARRTTEAVDGHITQLEIVDIYKRPLANGDREYFYKVKVNRENTLVESIVYRSFKELMELVEKLSRTFTLARFDRITRSKPTKREMAVQRKEELQQFLTKLFAFNREIAHSDIVYTFFQNIHRDQQFRDEERAPNVAVFRPIGQSKLKLRLNFDDNGLHVLVMYARNLETARNSTPDTYVKLYLQPDPTKQTKQKTKVISKNANPTFMVSIDFKNFKLDELKNRNLEVSVWANDISGNSRIGVNVISLRNIDLKKKIENWYQLKFD